MTKTFPWKKIMKNNNFLIRIIFYNNILYFIRVGLIEKIPQGYFKYIFWAKINDILIFENRPKSLTKIQNKK